MMALITLLLLGLALIVFGAFVLLRHSDRPGGTIKWLGAEVTSKGAGLPLIGLGVGCIVVATVRYDGGHERGEDSVAVRDTSQKPDTRAIGSLRSQSVNGDGSCIATWMKGVPPDRVTEVEEGGGPVEIIGSHQVLDQPFAVVLMQDGKRIGAVRVRLYRGKNSSGDVYKVEDAIDAGCTTVRDLRNAGRGGDPRRLHNWDALAATFGTDAYEVRIGGEGNINVGHFTRIHSDNR